MKASTFAAIVLAMAVAGAGAVPACSSTTTTPATATDTTTVHIKASEGGTVSDPGGNAALKIPAGALENDTDITIKVAAASDDALTSVYDFGPDGTTFTTSATLEIKAAASLAPAGKVLVVATSSGGSFQPIVGSTYAAGVASAPVAHFSRFSVIAVDGTMDAGTDAPPVVAMDSSADAPPVVAMESGIDAPPVTAMDSATDALPVVAMDSAADAPPVVAGDCMFVGTYTLEKYLCGTTDITPQWKTVFPTETLVVTNKVGTGCSMQLTHTAPACVEVENLSAVPISGSSYTFSFLGITSCAPASCTFAANDAPCAVGDRVKSGPSTFEMQGSKLHIVQMGMPGDVCGGQNADLLFAP